MAIGYTLSELVTAVRSSTGLTLEELAQLAGVSMNTVWRVERGMRPGEATVEKLRRGARIALARSKEGIAKVEATLLEAHK